MLRCILIALTAVLLEACNCSRCTTQSCSPGVVVSVHASNGALVTDFTAHAVKGTTRRSVTCPGEVGCGDEGYATIDGLDTEPWDLVVTSGSRQYTGKATPSVEEQMGTGCRICIHPVVEVTVK